MAPDSVNLVDKNDAGRALLALLEHVAHAAGTDADKHLNEVGARDGEERHPGLAGDGAGKEGLAGSGRADEKHALRNLAPQALEALRVAEELHHLFQLLSRLVDPGDIGEGDLPLALGQEPGAGLAKAHGPPPAGLHLAHEEDPHPDEEEHGEPRDED